MLRNPVPASFMEDFSDSALIFVLHVHVPEPSLAGRVRHRLFTQIQKRFKEAGIAIPLPTQELLVKPIGDPRSSPDGRPARPPAATTRRTDPALAPARRARPTPVPAPVEDCHRGVDE